MAFQHTSKTGCNHGQGYTRDILQLMKKVMCLLRGLATETHAGFRERVLALCQQLASKDGLAAVKLVLTEQRPPLFSVIPFRKEKIAVVSVKSKADGAYPELASTSGFVGAYEVTEALPVSYTRGWKDGEPTPGVCLLTLFNQKKGITYQTFLDRWHNGHTPLSLQVHPLWNYNRNVVERGAEDNLEHWDGIVEEHFRARADLLNPFRFFGGAARVVPNMIGVYRDTKSFLDYGSIEPYLAMEYHLKS